MLTTGDALWCGFIHFQSNRTHRKRVSRGNFSAFRLGADVPEAFYDGGKSPQRAF